MCMFNEFIIAISLFFQMFMDVRTLLGVRSKECKEDPYFVKPNAFCNTIGKFVDKVTNSVNNVDKKIHRFFRLLAIFSI